MNYRLSLNASSCRELSKKIDNFRKDIVSCKKNYILKCLEWIRKRSIEYLDTNDDFYPSYISDIRNNIKFYIIDRLTTNNNHTIIAMSYESEIACWVEFGTGQVGLSNPHPMAYESPQYTYASGKHSSNENGYWVWKNPKYDNGFHTTMGYVGKRFIYEAFRDFIIEEIYIKYYEEYVNKFLLLDIFR